MTNKKLLLELTTPEDDERPVFLTGNFNGWALEDGQYGMQKAEKGKYFFEFPETGLLPETLEYKYLRGDWSGVELTEYGGETPNRVISREAGKVHDFVPHWKKAGLWYDPMFLPKPEIISEQFEIPQLIKTRRISALLPYDYDRSGRRYPVLYLQDGQNLFDEYAPFGNWAVNKRLAIMAQRGLGDIIIVAIDHAEEERIREFTPSTKTRLGIGEGKKYVRFLADTLKPYVDQHFRTLPEREHTGIGGSSMGALISIYAGLMYPEVYSKLLVFSPSLWVAPNIPFHTIHFYEPFDVKMYLYGGGEESDTMIPSLKRFKESFEKQGATANFDFKLSFDPQGKHNEKHWGREFPKAVEWLFFTNRVE